MRAVAARFAATRSSPRTTRGPKRLPILRHGARRTRGEGGFSKRRPLPEHCCAMCRKASKVMALEAPPAPKLEGWRQVVCRKCHQPRMVAAKPAPSPEQIAAKVARETKKVEEARRVRAEMASAFVFMHRHRVGDKVSPLARTKPL